ncbi:hypothetical protein [Stutzerimonas nitrititolerans]|uniref:hypothetical protein n=1 Tax=Stutzerimonas nitrititolerans TaxID=2482751 RepID=UPI0028AF35EE|nr:hypothetical protein [Stutzerimonas nitrititolerans]
MPVTKIPVSFNSCLIEALTPRFTEHFGDWLSSQRALGSTAHGALPYLERLDPAEAAQITLQFVLIFSRPGLISTPVSEVGDRLGVLAVAIAEPAGKPPVRSPYDLDHSYRLVGAKLVELFAESTGLLAIQQEQNAEQVFMLNPETTQRAPLGKQPVQRARIEDDDASPRTERMLRALRDMRDLRERRQLRYGRATAF